MSARACLSFKTRVDDIKQSDSRNALLIISPFWGFFCHCLDFKSKPPIFGSIWFQERQRDQLQELASDPSHDVHSVSSCQPASYRPCRWELLLSLWSQVILYLQGPQHGHPGRAKVWAFGAGCNPPVSRTILLLLYVSFLVRARSKFSSFYMVVQKGFGSGPNFIELFRANTPTKENYTWLYPQAYLFIVSSYPNHAKL